MDESELWSERLNELLKKDEADFSHFDIETQQAEWRSVICTLFDFITSQSSEDDTIKLRSLRAANCEQKRSSSARRVGHKTWWKVKHPMVSARDRLSHADIMSLIQVCQRHIRSVDNGLSPYYAEKFKAALEQLLEHERKEYGAAAHN